VVAAARADPKFIPPLSFSPLIVLQGGQIGGKGSVRRKKTAVHKASAVDDKKLQTTLKRLAVNTIPGIEEVRGLAGV
jgi:hypothetical protein